MIKNFIIHSLRNFKKDRFFSILNLLGLALGIATCIVIFSYVQFEFSYDQFHTKKDRIFRVLTQFGNANSAGTLIVSGARVGSIANNDIPEVEMATRLYFTGMFFPHSVKVDDKVFEETDFIYADPNFFEVFDFKLIDGQPKEVLKDSKSIVITESIAKKYFGNEYPIGKSMFVHGRQEFVVSGVMEDTPANSHIKLGLVGSFELGAKRFEGSWFPMNFVTYILAKDKADASVISAKIYEVAEKELGEMLKSGNQQINLLMQPLTDIYMTSDIRMDIGRRGSETKVLAFALIGVFILLIACINYINLSTAQSEKRSKEVGIRKVMGSPQGALIRRFYGETAFITLFAIILATGIVELCLPYFNELVDEQIPFNLFSDPNWSISLFTLWILVTLMAGSYPAIYLSSFKPVDVLRGTYLSAKSGDRFRKILVVLQFAISIFLIIGTIVIYNQVMYAGEKEMGYDTEEIIILPTIHKDVKKNIKNIRSELESHSGILATTRASEVMGTVKAGYSFEGEGMLATNNNNCFGFSVEQNSIKTMGLEIIAGTDFEDISKEDTSRHYIINEELVKRLGWTPEESIGKRFKMSPAPWGSVKGVVKDFHYNSLRAKIAPIVIFTNPQYNYLYIRFNLSQQKEVVPHIESVFNQNAPEAPFEPIYLNTQLAKLYDNEVRTANVLLLFTVLSIIIGCLGLFGLTTFLVEKRTKEIGIRKVLGAEANQIVRILSWDFIKLIIVSCLVACPVAYYVMSDWLNNFAYHISISVTVFLMTIGIAILIAFTTVFFHSYKAAIANPADAIRDE